MFADKTTGTVTIGSAAATFENYGTYRKSGSGTTTVTQTFNNYSPTTLEVSDGIFTISGGGTDNHATPRTIESGRSARILVADDDRVNHMVFKQMIGLLGHETVAVKNGQEAVNRARNEKWDLILMDV